MVVVLVNTILKAIIAIEMKRNYLSGGNACSLPPQRLFPHILYSKSNQEQRHKAAYLF